MAQILLRSCNSMHMHGSKDDIHSTAQSTCSLSTAIGHNSKIKFIPAVHWSTGTLTHSATPRTAAAAAHHHRPHQPRQAAPSPHTPRELQSLQALMLSTADTNSVTLGRCRWIDFARWIVWPGSPSWLERAGCMVWGFCSDAESSRFSF